MSGTRENLHGVLVGINAYISPVYRPLRGAAADAEAVAAYLQGPLEVPRENLQLLVAVSEEDSETAGTFWPTAANLVRAIRGIKDRAHPGDQVLFFFAGHGATARTLVPCLRGPEGRDRALVPVDIDGPGGSRFLRDVELSFLIGELADAELQVTVVLDCCHSGGGLRSVGRDDLAVRGGNFDSRPPLAGLVAMDEELAASFIRARESRNRLRPADIQSGWELPTAAVVVAACRAGEAAYEMRFDGTIRGLFSYWWLNRLRHGGRGLSYRELHNQVAARVRSAAENQMPMLEGESERQVFGEERRSAIRGILVQHADLATGRVVLGAGRVQGIGIGARFELKLPDGRLSVWRVDEVDAVLAAARAEDPNLPLPEPGDLARLTDPGTAQWRARVRLDESLPAALTPDLVVAIDASGFLQEKPTNIDFLVFARPSGVAIGTGDGAILLELAGAPTAWEVVDRLEHLTRWRNLHDLHNSIQSSPLAGQVQLNLRRPPAAWRHPQWIDPEQGEVLPSGSAITDGEIVWLVIENRSKITVSCAVFDLQPDWGCSRLIPNKRDSHELEGGRSEGFPLRWRYVELGRPCRDRLKLLACVGATDFSWLELPLPKFGMKSLPPNVLQPLPSLGSLTWTTDQVDFEVLPPAPGSAS